MLVRQLTEVSAAVRKGVPPPQQEPPQQPKVADKVRRKGAARGRPTAETALDAAVSTHGLAPRVAWRRVVGAFQLAVRVKTKEALLRKEERLLATLRWLARRCRLRSVGTPSCSATSTTWWAASRGSAAIPGRSCRLRPGTSRGCPSLREAVNITPAPSPGRGRARGVGREGARPSLRSLWRLRGLRARNGDGTRARVRESRTAVARHRRDGVPREASAPRRCGTPRSPDPFSDDPLRVRAREEGE